MDNELKLVNFSPASAPEVLSWITTRDEARAWVVQPEAESQADGDRENEDEVSTKGLRSPIKDYAVGEDVTGGDRGSC